MKQKIYNRKDACNCRGQTLIFSVVALVILLVAALFLFDLQSIIRGKIKSQLATDAAALAACEWQVKTLNLIGELNILKACTVLVSDIPPFGDGSPEGLQSSAELLSEMQARIAFVGPIIGFGAAQQAAKNNGLNPNAFYTSVVGRHIERLSEDMSGDNPSDPFDDFYTDFYYYGIPKKIEGYEWRYPYKEMLEEVNYGQSGIAVAPNVEYAGLPNITPPWLMDIHLYEAISSEYWCYRVLRYLVKSYDFSGKWWEVTIDSSSHNFPYESEYFPVFVEFTGAGDTDTLSISRQFLEPLAEERKLSLYDEYNTDESEDRDGINSPLPYVKWCIYESSWNKSPDPVWLDDDFLRSGLRREYATGGAVCKMTCETDQPSVSTSYYASKDYSHGKFIEQQRSLEPVVPVGEAKSGLRKKYLEKSTCSSLAKPLGYLENSGTRFPPHFCGMVLPVFDKARLIPIAMQDPGELYNPFDYTSEELLKFLKWLADVNDLNNPPSNPPGPLGPWFLACLQKLNDEKWRSKGYNRNYTYQPPGYTKPYNPATGEGAGWLQMGYQYQYDGAGNPTGIIKTNEDTCDSWPSGGGGGGRWGPPILH